MSKFLQAFSPDNEVFRAYALCTGVTISKMLIMGPLTCRYRWKNKIFASAEDVRTFYKNAQANVKDDEIERVRRAHRNDLENCLPLMTIGFLYELTEPEASLAVNLIRAGAIARIVHSVAYLNGWQPLRALSYIVGVSVTSYMIYKVIMFFK